MHILCEAPASPGGPGITVAGVVEVKSYQKTSARLREQLDKHSLRVGHGLRVGEVTYPADHVAVGVGSRRVLLRIEVVPDDWKLPRTFRFETTARGRVLRVDPGVPPAGTDHVDRLSDAEWRVTLRWSHEALAEAAYAMTFWYMERIGEVVYDKAPLPEGWEGMALSDVGANSAKMMLYYAILRANTAYRYARAVALYNAYGFGYALGMHFRDPKGRREMLWFEDLEEILQSGRTKEGFRIT